MMEDHRPAAAPESRPRGLQVHHFIVETERRFRHWGTSMNRLIDDLGLRRCYSPGATRHEMPGRDGGSATVTRHHRRSATKLVKCTLRHEYRRSKRRCVTVPEMKEGPSDSAIRSLIPNHRELLRSKPWW